VFALAAAGHRAGSLSDRELVDGRVECGTVL
jgi:hypothetical protein